MSTDRSQTTHPSSPMNDREFAVWEHGRIQGHNEARREIDRMRPRLRKIANAQVPQTNEIAVMLTKWAQPRDGEVG